MSRAVTTLGRLRSATRFERVTGRKLSDVLKTLAVVVPMTLLIWVYAERAQTQPATVSVAVSFVLADPTMVATLPSASSNQVVVRVSGPRGQIERLKDRLDEADHDRVRVQLPPAYSAPGDYDVPLEALLRGEPVFSDSGVTIAPQGTTPLSMKVNVDKLAAPRDAAVELPRDVPQGLTTLENVRFRPATVTFRGPAAAMDKAFPGREARVVVNLGGITADQLPVGQDRSIEVPLVLPRDVPLTPSVQQVTMTFNLTSRKVLGTVLSVPVEVQRPVAQDGRSRVAIKKRSAPVIYNVQISGPADEVAKYAGDNPTQLLTAVLRVSQNDVGKPEQDRPVEFPSLPKGITVEGTYPITFEVQPTTDADR